MTREEAIKIINCYDIGFYDLSGEKIPADKLAEAFDMAIEALSADAVQIPIKLEKRYPESKDEDITDAFMRGYLAGRSSADAEWIPCSERLPKRDELVLVTYKTTDRIHLCRYLDDGSENSWWSYIDDCCAWNNVVLAWMPLPKPYKGGDDE